MWHDDDCRPADDLICPIIWRADHDNCDNDDADVEVDDGDGDVEVDEGNDGNDGNDGDGKFPQKRGCRCFTTMHFKIFLIADCGMS